MLPRDAASPPASLPAVAAVVGRNATIDVARGIAIIAIVLGHVVRGTAGAGLLDPDGPAAVVLDRTLYLFHLTVFAFVSGLFIARAVETRGRTPYLRDRILLFAYLYIVWSAIQVAVKLLTGSLVNEPVKLAEAFDPLRPEGQLWFLPWLIVASMLALLLRPWRSRLRAAVVLTATSLMSVLAWGTDPGVIGTQGLALYVFFVTGAVIGAGRFTRIVDRLAWPVLAALVLVAGAVLIGVGAGTLATVPTSYADQRTATSVLLGVLGAVAGVLAVLAVSALVARSPSSGRPLAWIGRYSLEIFLAHIIFAAGTRIVLTLLGVSEPVVVILVATVVGVIAPVLLAVSLRRLRFPWLFVLPRRARRR